jgi:hypothetical protein
MIFDSLQETFHGFEDGFDLAVCNDVIDVFSVVDPFISLFVNSKLVSDFFERFLDLFIISSDRIPSIYHGSLPFLQIIFRIFGFFDWRMFANGIFDISFQFLMDFIQGNFHHINGGVDCGDLIFDLFYKVENFLFIFPFDSDKTVI